MSDTTRRQFLERAGQAVCLTTIAGAAAVAVRRSCALDAWAIDPNRCVNIRLGVNGPENVCQTCAQSCVLSLSAVRAVNDCAQCGRCCICPAYFDVQSAVGADGLPTKKLCPRDAIIRQAIGEVDPYDPLNNYYEYTIDEEKCNGCGRCVMECKDPAGLGSIRLEVRYDLCLRCNRCTIAVDCPDDAYVRIGPQPAPRWGLSGAHG
jgi:electron transport complex protein RnfB